MFHVKHGGGVQMAETLRAMLAEAGISVSEAQIESLLAHLAMVMRANRDFNLTRIVDEASAIRLHLLDSLMVMPEIDAAPPGRIVDIGSGAGFPGIPLWLTTGRDVVLVESVQKKARFLQDSIDSLVADGGATVSPTRSEEYALENPANAAVVTARAVAPLESLVELASPILQTGGVLLALKAAVSTDELENGDIAANLCGLVRQSLRTYRLPGLGAEKRSVVSYIKQGDPKILLPRRPGVARKRPLGSR